VAVLLVGAGLAVWLSGEETGAAGLLLRVGAVVGAVWVAYPLLVEASWKRLIWLGPPVVVAMIRPRAAWVVVLVALLVLGWGRVRR
jgi:hypothetical protein